MKLNASVIRKSFLMGGESEFYSLQLKSNVDSKDFSVFLNRK